MTNPNRSVRPSFSLLLRLGLVLSCPVGVGCASTAPSAPATGATPAATGARVTTTSQQIASSTHPDLDMSGMSRWHLCKVDDPADCTEQCRTGHLPSCVRLGNMYLAGRPVKQDLALAAKLYELPCAHNSGEACSNKAIILYSAHDFAGAAKYYSRSCDSENPDGCYSLGKLYAEGIGVEQDLPHAATLYQKACDEGESRGCSDLGMLHLRGKGVALDYARATRLFDQACQANNPRACANLGSAYAQGVGVTRDGTRSEALYRRACEGGLQEFCGATRPPAP